ncbi:hypothetical protein ACFVH6_25525 [Spirillospora sp. NPDC127200]
MNRTKLYDESGRKVGSRTTGIKRGERLRLSDPQHRTKGAAKLGKGKKPYVASGRPAGHVPTHDDLDMLAAALIQRARASARTVAEFETAKREIKAEIKRRKRMERQAAKRATGVEIKRTPGLKTPEKRFYGDFLSADYGEMEHEALSRKDNQEPHEEWHAKRGRAHCFAKH